MDVYTHPAARQQNRGLVLRLLCTGVADTRVALARRTGLSKMTVGKIVGGLIEEGVLAEGGAAGAGGQGRQPQRLALAETAPLAAGVYIARGTCWVVLTDLAARLVQQASLEVRPGVTAAELLDGLYALYKTLAARQPNPILGVGVASLGPIDKPQGRILNPPNFGGLHTIAVRDYFEEKTGLPVIFDNNMNASAIAEQLFGNGRALHALIYIGVTHGVGAGFISGGRLLEGATGVGGEIGHNSIKFDGPLCQCGNRGCLELYTSIPRLLQQAALRLDGPVSWPALAALAREGRPEAQAVLDDFVRYMAVGVTALVNLLDCGDIFLGHDIALAAGLVEKPLEEAVNRQIFSARVRRVRVTASAFGQASPLVGSACLVLQRLFYPLG